MILSNVIEYVINCIIIKYICFVLFVFFLHLYNQSNIQHRFIPGKILGEEEYFSSDTNITMASMGCSIVDVDRRTA